MAQALTFNPGPVQNITLNVYVNGVLRPHRSVDFGGDTPGGLPDQVVSAGTGMRSRTGTIHWATPKVQKEAPHPVRREDGWPPREGDDVVIEAVGAFGVSRRFTGRLGKVTGSLVDGTLTSDITDRLADHLSTPVSIEPMLTGAQGQSYRIAWEAIERAGLGLLMEAEGDGDTILHWTPQGDSWPTIGGNVSGTHTVTADPFGVDVVNGPTIECLGTGRGGRGIMVIARGATASTSTVRVRMDDESLFTLSHSPGSGMLTMTLDGVTIRTEPYVGEGLPILAFGLSGDLVRLWTSGTTRVDFFLDAPMLAWPARVWGDRLAAAHVRYVPTLTYGGEMVARLLEYPAAMHRTALATGRLPATRGFENVTAREVVESWSDSTLSSFWMDEFGRTHLVARDRLKTRPTSRTVRLDQRLFAGSWSIGDDSVYSGVTVRGQQGLVQGSPREDYRVTIYQEQTARVVTEAEDFERFIEAPPEVDWGPIDLIPSRWTSNASVTGTQPEYGTWIHAVVPYDAGGGKLDRWAWDNVPVPSVYNAQFERLGQRTLKVSEQVVPGVGIADGVFLKSPERKEYQLLTWIWSPYRDLPSPIIRARWTSTWTDYAVHSGGGPAHAPTLEHDIGWWNTRVDAQKIVSSLAAEVTSPMATFSDVTMLWDPRRQIGDVENWIAVDSRGEDTWSARVLVVGYRESWEDGVPSQVVSVRVLSMTDIANGKSYTDMAAAYADYNQVDDYSATYSDVYNALPDRYMGD